MVIITLIILWTQSNYPCFFIKLALSAKVANVFGCNISNNVNPNNMYFGWCISSARPLPLLNYCFQHKQNETPQLYWYSIMTHVFFAIGLIFSIPISKLFVSVRISVGGTGGFKSALIFITLFLSKTTINNCTYFLSNSVMLVIFYNVIVYLSTFHPHL